MLMPLNVEIADVNMALVAFATCAVVNAHNKLPALDIKSEVTDPEQLVVI